MPEYWEPWQPKIGDIARRRPMAECVCRVCHGPGHPLDSSVSGRRLKVLMVGCNTPAIPPCGHQEGLGGHDYVAMILGDHGEFLGMGRIAAIEMIPEEVADA